MRNLKVLLDYTSLAILVLSLLWLALPSAVFLRPSVLYYDQNTGYATLTRTVHFFDAVHVRYKTEMRVLSTGIKCQAANSLNVVTYHKHDEPAVSSITGEPLPLGTVMWPIEDEFWPCVAAEPPLVVEASWWVLLFGVIPLRPVTITDVLEN